MTKIYGHFEYCVITKLLRFAYRIVFASNIVPELSRKHVHTSNQGRRIAFYTLLRIINRVNNAGVSFNKGHDGNSNSKTYVGKENI